MKTLTTLIIITALTAGLSFTPPALAHHGGGTGMGMMHGGGSWKATLSDEQQAQIAKLKLDYKKKKYPLKAKLKQAKVDLALLMTEDNPSQKNINKKIDEIVQLKSQKMRLKANHKIAVRKLLNENQRVKFDMKIMKKAFHGKKHRRHH